MVKNDTLVLLRKMYMIEIEKFLINQSESGRYSDLDKQGKIQNCFNRIITYLKTNVNSITIVTNFDETMSIIVKNVKEDNDHVNNYILTIADNFETFQVEEVDQPIENIIRRVIKHFETIRP